MKGPDDLYGTASPTFTGLPLFDLGDPFERSKTEPTAAERTVAELIWKHRGHSNPISTAELLERLSAADRRGPEKVIERLRGTHKIPIGSKRTDPPGYFIMETLEDWLIGTEHYRRQLVSGWQNLRAMEPPRHILLELQGQMRIEA